MKNSEKNQTIKEKTHKRLLELFGVDLLLTVLFSSVGGGVLKGLVFLIVGIVLLIKYLLEWNELEGGDFWTYISLSLGMIGFGYYIIKIRYSAILEHFESIEKEGKTRKKKKKKTYHNKT